MSTKRQIFDDKLYAHFITFTVDRRRRLLDHDHPKRMLLGVLNGELSAKAVRCIGYVIMPDHVHVLVWFPVIEQLSSFMHGLKRKSSFHIRNWYREEAANYFRGFGEGDRFLLPKYHAFEIYSRAKLEEKLNYMHENPVRAGLVKCAIDWPWSSARWYAFQQSVGVPIQWIE